MNLTKQVGLMNTCMPGTTTGTILVGSCGEDIIILGLSFAFGLFVLESIDALSMVKCAGCHWFLVLWLLKSLQQPNNQHLLNPF